MPVITIAQRKGGAGKTTLACQLAAAFAAEGFTTAGLDLDDQKSFTRWADLRRRRLGAEALHFETGAGFGFSANLRRAREAADIVIIDTPPTADASVARAVAAADLVLAPMQLTPLDLDASLPTARMIGAARKDALFVVNRAPPRARIADLIRDGMRTARLPTAATELGSRAAFAESLASGLGVVETDASSLAAAEIGALANEVAARLKLACAAA